MLFGSGSAGLGVENPKEKQVVPIVVTVFQRREAEKQSNEVAVGLNERLSHVLRVSLVSTEQEYRCGLPPLRCSPTPFSPSFASLLLCVEIRELFILGCGRSPHWWLSSEDRAYRNHQ